MNSKLLLRIASVLLVIFAAGHTVGFLKFRPPTPEGRAVLEAMNRVHFSVGGSTFSYGGFYVGFGLFVTAYLLFSVLLAWQLGGLSEKYADVVGPLVWTFFAVQVATGVLSFIYFSLAPAVFSVLVAACVGGAAWLLRTGADLRPSRATH